MQGSRLGYHAAMSATHWFVLASLHCGLAAASAQVRNTAEPAREGAFVPREVPEQQLEVKSRRAEVSIVYHPLDLEHGGEGEPVLAKVSAVVEDAPGIGPAQIVVEPRPEDIHPMRDLSGALPNKIGGWPKDCIIVLKGEDAPVSNFAAGVLIRSMLAGRKIPGNIVLVGELSLDMGVHTRFYPLVEGGYLSRWAAETQRVDKVPMRLVGGEADAGEVFQNLRFGERRDTTSIHSCQIIGCKDLDEVLAVAGIVEREGLADVLVRFDQTQRVVRERGDEILKHPKVAERLAEATAALPHHLTAAYYAGVASGEIAKHRSKASSGQLLFAIWEGVNASRTGRPGEDIGGILREAQSKLDRVDDNLHPEAVELAEEMAEFLRTGGPLLKRTVGGAFLSDGEVERLRKLDEQRSGIDRKLRALIRS